jgi:hypothetical protein
MKLFTPEDIRKYFYASFFLALICLLAALYLVASAGTADLYIKTTFDCENCSGGTYHQGRVGESVSFKDVSSAGYHYEKDVDDDTGTTGQTSEFTMEGGEASYWNYHRTWTEEDIAGANQLKLHINEIGGSYYGKNGMDITYNEADGSEEFESSLTIETDSAKLQLRVIDWMTGKPVSLEDIDLIGKIVLDQLVKLSEAIEDVKGFCESLDRDEIISSEAGAIRILPVNTSRYNYTWEDGKMLRQLNGSAWA